VGLRPLVDRNSHQQPRIDAQQLAFHFTDQAVNYFNPRLIDSVRFLLNTGSIPYPRTIPPR